MKVKGYTVPSGYMGWVDKLKKYVLFASESDYREYIEEE